MYVTEKKTKNKKKTLYLPKSVEVFIRYYCALHLTCVSPQVRLVSLGQYVLTSQ